MSIRQLRIKTVTPHSEFDDEPVELKSKGDAELKKVFDNDRFFELNSKILYGVTETYKNEMIPVCSELIENDRLVGRIPQEGEKETKRKRTFNQEDIEIKDPRRMSSFELFKESSMLAIFVQKLKEQNEKARDSLEILKLAAEALDLDIGYRSVELNIGGTPK